MIFQGIREIVARHLGNIARTIDTASGVNQTPAGIEDVEMRCAQGAVGPGDILGFIAQVHPREFVLLHAFDHVRERILFVGVLAVRIDADESDALGLKTQRGLPRGFVRTRDVRTMIAGKENDEHARVLEIREPV